MRILSRSFLRGEDGAVVALAALSIPIMMLAIGAAMFAPDEPGDAGDTPYQPDGSTWWSYANSYLNDNPKKECKDVKSNPNEYADAQTKLCKYQNQSSLTTSGGRGPNYNCNAKPLLRLTADATALHASVNAMAANGNTNLLEVLMWGWRTISPNAPFADAKPYKTADNEKIIILLTDGMNAWSSANNHNKSVYSSFGYYTGGRLTDAGKPNPTNSTEARAQIASGSAIVVIRRQLHHA